MSIGSLEKPRGQMESFSIVMSNHAIGGKQVSLRFIFVFFFFVSKLLPTSLAAELLLPLVHYYAMRVEQLAIIADRTTASEI